MYEMGIPQGLVLRKLAGSDDALKNLLLNLKKHRFCGYVEVILTMEKEAHGYILVDDGQVSQTFWITETNKYTGEKASKEIWQASKNPTTVIVLHGQVNLDEVKNRILGFIEGRLETKKDTELDIKLRILRSKGVDVSEIQKIAAKSPEIAESKVRELEEFLRLSEEINKFLLENAKILEKHSKSVSDLKNALAKKEKIEHIRRMFDALKQAIAPEKTPETVEIETKHLKELEELIRQQKEDEERKKRETAVYSLVIHHRAKTQEKVVPFCSRCGSPLDRDGQCLKCNVEEESLGKIVPKFTLTNFIVGTSNRFAYAVAYGISKFPGRLYNPVFLHGPDGCGKTHLLNAVAGALQQGVLAEKTLVFTTLPVLSAIFEKYRENPSNLATRLLSSDALFIDNFEECTGKEELQKFLAGIITKLVDTEKQIVIASRFSPTEIPKMDTDLLLCFTKGLLVNIQEPDFETRREILKRYAQEHGVILEPEVINYVAGINLSVEEISIILNRLFALSTINNQTIDLNLVKEAMREYADKYGFKGKLKYNVQKGHSYLVEETRPAIVFQIVSTMREAGCPAIIFSRINPKRIVERFDKLQGSTIYWLTEKETNAETIGHSLERIVYAIEEKLDENPRTVIALDGIEFLVSANGFDAVVKFIRKIIDMVAETEGLFLISLGESTLNAQEIKILERELEVLIKES
ncbi:MAG: DnaA ATPase domain-containing protein [Thermoplasmata archaeon]